MARVFALVLSVFVVVGVGGVIDGNVDGIWWQVLAVAFRRHWAVGGQVLAVDGLPSRFEPRCDTLGLGLVAPGYEARAVCGVEQQAEMPPPAHEDLHCTRSSGQGLARTILLPRQVGGFWPIGMLQLVPAGFIHPLAANNLSIESRRRCDQIFCAYSDQSG